MLATLDTLREALTGTSPTATPVKTPATPPWTFVTDGTPPDNSFYSVNIICNDQNIRITAYLPQEFTFSVASTYNEAFAQGVNGMLPSVGNADQYTRAFGLQLSTQALSAQVWQGTSEVDFQLRLVFVAETDVYKDVDKPIADLMRLVLPREVTPGGLLSAPGPSLDFDRMKKAIMSPAFSASMNRGGAQLGDAASGTADAVTGQNGGFYPNAVRAAEQFRDGTSTILGTASAAMRHSLKNVTSLEIGKDMLFPIVVVTSVSQVRKVRPLKGKGNFTHVEVDVGFKSFFTLTQSDIPTIFLNRV
jgi:hypothetical protein